MTRGGDGTKTNHPLMMPLRKRHEMTSPLPGQSIDRRVRDRIRALRILTNSGVISTASSVAFSVVPKMVEIVVDSVVETRAAAVADSSLT